MIRSLIIDDEVKSRETIIEMMRLYCGNVSVIGQAGDVSSGLEAIRTLSPELVFLDIKMPDGTGFDLLNQLPKIDFKVIFITAYEEYAIKAFKFSALDYILKPIDPNELITAIEKTEKSLEKDNLNLKLNTFLTNLDSAKEEKKIILKTADSINLVNVNEIIRCESDRNYTQFFMLSGERIMVSKSLKEFVDLLQEYNFFRIHQSHMINIGHIRRYDREESNCIMSDSSIVPVSCRKKDQLLNIFNEM